ncbi:50S ribosomal protein L30 [Candidatus Bathyarchaeota archaeon]|nr:50S ribosomal protein L30 [Candidatus Bathyarchaeota archaeon]
MIAVRVRGTISARREARETLQMLRLTRNNRAVLIDNRPAFVGMLNVVRAYVTWGEASKETVMLLLSKRGRLVGDKKLTEEYLQKISYKSIEKLADALFNCKAEYWKLPQIQPYFKLHPPTKGFKGNIKRSFTSGGELGYRGAEINALVNRML